MVNDDMCFTCLLPDCDEFAKGCKYTQAVNARKAAIRTVKEITKREALRQWSADLLAAKMAKRDSFVPDNSMRRRYDKRCKPDTPRRQWERQYRAKRKGTRALQSLR